MRNLAGGGNRVTCIRGEAWRATLGIVDTSQMSPGGTLCVAQLFMPSVCSSAPLQRHPPSNQSINQSMNAFSCCPQFNVMTRWNSIAAHDKDDQLADFAAL